MKLYDDVLRSTRLTYAETICMSLHYFINIGDNELGLKVSNDTNLHFNNFRQKFISE